MKNSLISIVVPIYNVEKYLNECIDSIIAQTYKNIEIILVDDGSPDSCPVICDNWKEKDYRVKVIHKENGGLSDARNVGIENAKGNYICFIDSDDYVEKNYVEELYNKIVTEEVKISQCGIKYVDDNHQIIKNVGYKNNCVLPGRKVIEDSCDKHFTENEVVWNRLYDINLFKNLKFPKGKLHEDEYITYKLLYNEEKIAIVSNCLYNYRQSDNSIMRSNYSLKRFYDFLEAYKEKIDYFKNKKDIVIHDMVIKSYLSNLSNIYIKIKKSIQNPQSYLKSIKEEYKKYYKYIKRSKNIGLKNKIKVSIFYFSPYIYTLLKTFK